MGFLVFCDVDEEGNITEYIAGKAVIPGRQYDHFIYLEKEIDVSFYKMDIESRKLVLK